LKRIGGVSSGRNPFSPLVFTEFLYGRSSRRETCSGLASACQWKVDDEFSALTERRFDTHAAAVVFSDDEI